MFDNAYYYTRQRRDGVRRKKPLKNALFDYNNQAHTSTNTVHIIILLCR